MTSPQKSSTSLRDCINVNCATRFVMGGTIMLNRNRLKKNSRPGNCIRANPYAESVDITTISVVAMTETSTLLAKYAPKWLDCHAVTKFSKYKLFGIRIGGYGMENECGVIAVASIYRNGSNARAEKMTSPV